MLNEKRSYSFNTKAQKEIVREIKEKINFFSKKFELEMENDLVAAVTCAQSAVLCVGTTMMTGMLERFQNVLSNVSPRSSRSFRLRND